MMTRFSPGFIFPPPAGAFSNFAFLASQQNASSVNPQNFNTLNFGTADPNRWLFACFAGGTAARSVTGVTIGGVTATKLADSNDVSAVQRPTSIWMANVPTGTSGNVVFTASGSNSVACALYGVISPTGVTVLDLAVQAGTSNAMALATVAGGALFGIDGAGGTAAAIGGDIDTTDVNGVLVVTGFRTTAAHEATPATGTASVTVGTLGSIGTVCVVSLKPT